MKQAEALAWFTDLADRANGLIKKRGQLGSSYDSAELSVWTTEASTALGSVFPQGHPIRASWDAALSALHSGLGTVAFATYIKRCQGVVEGARDIIKAGRLASFVDGIRAETVSELLDQAEDLADKKYVVPATVVAGGALETFLHFTCAKHELVEDGRHGSISTYVQALAVARKGGNEVIKATDEAQATAWGILRNSAAHKPGEFQESVERVKLMIEGIRQFISRYTG